MSKTEPATFCDLVQQFFPELAVRVDLGAVDILAAELANFAQDGGQYIRFVVVLRITRHALRKNGLITQNDLKEIRKEALIVDWPLAA